MSNRSGSRQEASLTRLGAELAKVFTEEDVEAAKQTIRDCLNATRTVRMGRDEQGHTVYEKVPDYPVRITAGVKIVEWAVGKPISRSIHAEIPNRGAKTGEQEFFEDALRDPEAAKSLQDALEKMISAAKKAAPVEVTVSPSLPEAPENPLESQS